MGSRKNVRPKNKNHAQDCGTLIESSASGDPAMVFDFWMASILSVSRAPCPLRPAAGLLLDTYV
jgi:hypothetical protein